MIAEDSLLWRYLSPQQRVLLGDGTFLLKDSQRHTDQEPTDYSYLVFPFAKMYEGFLKQLLRDLGITGDREYYSNHYRIGKALSPNLVRRLGRQSAYGQLEQRYGSELAEHLWRAWKEGRNQVFHYFPNNYRALTRPQAQATIELILEAMETAVRDTHVQPRVEPQPP